MNPTTLFIGLIAGSIGTGYIVYGRKQQRPIAWITGVALCVYPYLTDSPAWLIAIGVALAALPFVVRG